MCVQAYMYVMYVGECVYECVLTYTCVYVYCVCICVCMSINMCNALCRRCQSLKPWYTHKHMH